jgi:hypothetical protein
MTMRAAPISLRFQEDEDDATPLMRLRPPAYLPQPHHLMSRRRPRECASAPF